MDLGPVALQQLAGPNVLAVGDSNLRVLGLQWSQIVTDRHRSQFDAVCEFLLCEFMPSVEEMLPAMIRNDKAFLQVVLVLRENFIEAWH